MGIEKLNPLIKRHTDEAFFTLPITKLSGKRVAIDAFAWMYANMAIARKKIIDKMDVTLKEPDSFEIRKEWLVAGINFTLTWVNNNITPVFVFDGKNTPPEKLETKLIRRSDANAKKEKIQSLYSQINSDILSNSPSLITELRKALCNYVTLSPDDVDTFKTVLQHIGVPCIQADGDGEKLCSSLCVEGKVAAVFSTDTDNLAYGCPLVINCISKTYTYEDGKKIINLDCVRVDKALQGLNLSYSSFIDLCIMCGCDFNTHMPGIAAIKAHNLIKEYEFIHNLPDKFDTTCLKYKRCREIFTYVKSEDLIIKYNHVSNELTSQLNELKITDFGIERTENITNKCNELNGKNLSDLNSLDLNRNISILTRDYFENIGISDQLHKIVPTYQNFKSSTSGLVDELNLIPINFQPLNPSITVVKPKLKLNVVK